MKQLIDRKNLFISILFASITLIFFILFFNFTYVESKLEYVSPIFTDAKGWEIYIYEGNEKHSLTPREVFETKQQVYYLSRTMSEANKQAGITTIQLDYTYPCALFLDNELFYSNTVDLKGELGSLEFPLTTYEVITAGETVTVTLPPDYVGKTLTYATMNIDYNRLPAIFLSSKAITQSDTTAALNRIIIPSAALALSTILLIGLWLYGGIHGKWNLSIFLLFIAAFVQTLYYVQDLGYYLPEKQFFNFLLLGLGRPLFVYLPIIYLWLQMRKYRKIAAPFLLIPAVLTIGSEWLMLLGINVGNLVYIAWKLLIPELFILIIFSFLEMRKNNSIFKIFVPAMAITTLSIIGVYVSSAFMNGFVASYINSIFSHLLIMIVPSPLINWIGALLFILCILISFIEVIQRSIANQTELKVLSLKIELAYENLRLMKQSSEDLAKMRHNVLHHFNVLTDLNQRGERELLADYLKQITNESIQILPLRVCEHPIVNAIVTRAMDLANRAEVELKVQLDVPAVLPVKEVDLCNYLMNMLDNAIQACADVPKGKRWIHLTMHIRCNYLFIEAVNSYEGEIYLDDKGNCISRKGEGHGYGIKTMREIAYRYHSDLHIEILPDRFIVQTAFLLKEEEV